jgi:polyhydroxyalkanoate synthesis regulator phasin
MGIDINLDFDQKTLRRITNLEERIRDIFTAQNNFASTNQVQQIITLLTTEIAVLTETVNSLEKRVSILEDIPGID